MRLRTRLAVTLGIATVLVLVVLGWAQSRFQSQVRLEGMVEAVVHRMESGGRDECEANPEHWPREARKRRGHLPWLSAYDANFASRNPSSPSFPRNLAERLSAGETFAASRPPKRRRAQVAIRMPWGSGPCAVLLVRTRGPLPWHAGPVLLPSLLVAVVVALVALFAAGPIVRRVRRLTEAVEGGQPIGIEGDDEIAELSRAFERSRGTIQSQVESLTEREAALRNYIAHTTHDVMLPLSVLQGHLVALQRRIEAGESLDANAFIPSIEESQYLGSLLHNLNAAARLESNAGLIHRDAIDLGRLVERVVDRHQPIARRKMISLNLAVPEETVTFSGDLTLLEQAFSNVVQNAVRYNSAGGHVAVLLEGNDANWSLKITDDGPGIPERERPRVVEPSFRGSAARTRHPHGMGLGLHIASDVGKRHGLTLTLSETEGGGLTVLFRTPNDAGRDT